MVQVVFQYVAAIGIACLADFVVIYLSNAVAGVRRKIGAVPTFAVAAWLAMLFVFLVGSLVRDAAWIAGVWASLMVYHSFYETREEQRLADRYGPPTLDVALIERADARI
jgi:hypothetical protein